MKTDEQIRINRSNSSNIKKRRQQMNRHTGKGKRSEKLKDGDEGIGVRPGLPYSCNLGRSRLNQASNVRVGLTTVKVK